MVFLFIAEFNPWHARTALDQRAQMRLPIVTLQRLQRNRTLAREHANGRALERFHEPADAEGSPQVAGDGTNVDSGTAIDFQFEHRKGVVFHVDAEYVDRSSFEFDLLSRPR